MPKFFTISLAATKSKADLCFGRVLLQSWQALGLPWFTSATGLTRGPWCCPLKDEFGRLENTPHHATLQSAPGVENGVGASTCLLKQRKCTVRLFITYLSASQKATGSLFSSSVKICLSALLVLAHNQMLCRSVPKISVQPNVCQSLGKPYSLRTICILSRMCFNFNPTGICFAFTNFWMDYSG